MLKRLFTAVILAGLFYQPVLNGAAGLTADVDKLVAQVDLTSRVPVIVKFKKSFNINGLRRSISKKHQYEPAIIKSQSRQKKQLRRRLLTGLQDQLIKPKAKLAKILRDHGVKTRLKSLWVINAVALDLPANLVDEIAAMPEVERITVDMIRSGDLEASASVKYKTIDGSAIKDSDYVDTSGTLTFPAGVTRRTIAIEIINDGLYEEESSFTLILSDASGNATITTPSAAIVRIIDDDALPFVSIHSSPGHSSGGLPSRFSSNREALEQDSIQNQTRSRSDRGSSLKIFDLSLRGYDSSALLDRLGLQAPEASVTTQPRDGDAEKHAEDNKKSECGSTAISADPGACGADNEKETAAPADSKDVQTVAEFPEVDADSTTGDAAPQATSDAPLGNSSESSPPQ
ncbi:MAG: Calx-beta domain-containing protein [Candidatus Thiodiazotropha endolucinida]|nr:hypothetical protein [Candidatus Thiodiazotropha taylori]MCG7890351.1 hypothetical protein [Candidatus Thiodiazotropha taylori]MCW4248559.1 hypothetical protein [Candidatus Thiodiazotropha endolucinida]MCW4271010.1 hypothetical protein [Candidatus Thiodiazotropha endolucinida]